MMFYSFAWKKVQLKRNGRSSLRARYGVVKTVDATFDHRDYNAIRFLAVDTIRNAIVASMEN